MNLLVTVLPNVQSCTHSSLLEVLFYSSSRNICSIGSDIYLIGNNIYPHLYNFLPKCCTIDRFLLLFLIHYSIKLVNRRNWVLPCLRLIKSGHSWGHQTQITWQWWPKIPWLAQKSSFTSGSITTAPVVSCAGHRTLSIYNAAWREVLWKGSRGPEWSALAPADQEVSKDTKAKGLSLLRHDGLQRWHEHPSSYTCLSFPVPQGRGKKHLCFLPQPGSVPLDSQSNVFKLPELGNGSQSHPFGPFGWSCPAGTSPQTPQAVLPSSPTAEVGGAKTLLGFGFLFNPLVFSFRTVRTCSYDIHLSPFKHIGPHLATVLLHKINIVFLRKHLATPDKI